MDISSYYRSKEVSFCKCLFKISGAVIWRHQLLRRPQNSFSRKTLLISCAHSVVRDPNVNAVFSPYSILEVICLSLLLTRAFIRNSVGCLTLLPLAVKQTNSYIYIKTQIPCTSRYVTELTNKQQKNIQIKRKRGNYWTWKLLRVKEGPVGETATKSNSRQNKYFPIRVILRVKLKFSGKVGHAVLFQPQRHHRRSQVRPLQHSCWVSGVVASEGSTTVRQGQVSQQEVR